MRNHFFEGWSILQKECTKVAWAQPFKELIVWGLDFKIGRWPEL